MTLPRLKLKQITFVVLHLLVIAWLRMEFVGTRSQMEAIQAIEMQSPPASFAPFDAAAIQSIAVSGTEPDSVGVYHARITRVIDGDTLDADVSIGIKITAHVRLRLLGINAPELHGKNKEKGAEAKAFVESMAMGKLAIIRSNKIDSFGRWLADVWVDHQHLNEKILASGNAVPFTSRRR